MPPVIPHCRWFLRLPTQVRSFSSVAKFDVVKPQKVTSQISADDLLSVPLPPYARTGIPLDSRLREPEIKDVESIVKMRRSCDVAKKILESVEEKIQVGVTTDEIDKFVHNLSLSFNAVSFHLLDDDMNLSPYSLQA